MSPPSACIIPKFYTMDGGRGTCNGNGSVSAWGPRKSYKLGNLLVPHRLLTEAIGLSMCPNDTHPYIEQNHEPKNLNPNSYQVVTHFYAGEGREPLPILHLLVSYVPLSFVLCYDALPLLVNSFHLFSNYLHLMHMLTKQTSPRQIHGVLKCKTNARTTNNGSR